MSKSATGGGYKSHLLSNSFKALCLFFCTAVFSAVFFGSVDYLGLADATDKDLQVNVNVSPILDLRTEKSGSTITELVLSATPNSSGTFVKDNLDVIVNTSNPTGYTLTFANKDTDTALHHTAPTSTDTITSLTATATDTTFPLNTWGYSTGDIASTQSFSPIPISTAPVVLKTTAAPASDDTTTVTFGANIGVNIASGTYEDTVVFSATTNYVPPAAATFTVAPVVTTNLSGGDTLTLDTDIDWIDDMGQMVVTIYSNATDGSICANPTAVKYQVSGQDKLRITCTSPAKGAGTYNVSLELLKFSQKYVASNTIEYKYRFYTISTMQEMTSDICAEVPTPSATETNVPQSTLSDTRDSKTYVIRKLADGNCWMLKNLDLDLSTSVALTNANTDLNSKASWTPQNSTQTTEGTVWPQDGGDVARSMNPGNIYFPGGVGTGSASAGDNLQGTTSGEPWEFIGNYYNWYAATAGSGTTAMVAPATATDSICPKNWKLPDNEGSKSFVNLIFTTYGLQDNDAVSSTKLLAAPLNFVRSGSYQWSTGQVYHKGARGSWWSATATSTTTNAQSLSTYSARVVPQNVLNKGYGLMLRCVAR